MFLHQLFRELDEIDKGGLPDLEVAGVTADSRQVSPGQVFVAVPGTSVDGYAFIGQAAQRGSILAIGEGPDPVAGIPYRRVPDARLTLARLAAAWHGYPARRLTMIGATGTDGKTTTCNLVHHILQAAGLRSGLVSTVNAVIGDQVLDTGLHVTTPEAMEVQAYLARMVEAGLTHCVLEATSHGLAQRRVAACDFDVAVMTNITHEHLDYHGSFESYRQAKALLFTGLSHSAPKDHAPRRMAILNQDDASYEFLRKAVQVPAVSYGLSPGADVFAADVESDEDGLRFVIHGPGYVRAVRSRLPGAFNVSNCLAAFAAAVEALGISPQGAAEGIAAFRGVPGRWERIDLGQPFVAIVDFAHTPHALQRVLETARQQTAGRVIAVFGSAGLRDREKRRLMPAVAVRLADETILTAEDPRSEPVEGILEEMAHGAVEAGGVEGQNFWRIPDRGEALRFAVDRARPGDLVIACGKGHEQSMCFDEVEYPWDDRTAMRAALADRLGLPGYPMPRLPTT